MIIAVDWDVKPQTKAVQSWSIQFASVHNEQFLQWSDVTGVFSLIIIVII